MVAGPPCPGRGQARVGSGACGRLAAPSDRLRELSQRHAEGRRPGTRHAAAWVGHDGQHADGRRQEPSVPDRGAPGQIQSTGRLRRGRRADDRSRAGSREDAGFDARPRGQPGADGRSLRSDGRRRVGGVPARGGPRPAAQSGEGVPGRRGGGPRGVGLQRLGVRGAGRPSDAPVRRRGAHSRDLGTELQARFPAAPRPTREDEGGERGRQSGAPVRDARTGRKAGAARRLAARRRLAGDRCAGPASRTRRGRLSDCGSDMQK